MRSLIALAALATASCAATPALADPVHYGDAGDWEIYRDSVSENPDCSAIVDFGDGSALRIFYMPVTNSAFINFLTSKASNFKPGSDVSLKIYFIQNRHLDDGWKEGEFHVTLASDNITRVLGSGVSGGETMLDDIAKSDIIAFWTHGDTRLIEAFPLKGSAVAIEALRECAYSLDVR